MGRFFRDTSSEEGKQIWDMIARAARGKKVSATHDTAPTAAAMRAAERIVEAYGDYPAREQAAAIIDAETGLPELIEAQRWSMSKIQPYTARIAEQNEAYCDAYDHARAALARYDKP
jgi:hypothetical protein